MRAMEDEMTFLSYFPAHRALQQEVQVLVAQLISAQDQVRLWRSRCEAAEARERKAIEAERRALMMVSNCEAIRSGSPVVPFPDVYVPMPEPARDGEDVAPEPRKRRASELVREMENEFAQEYGRQLDRELSHG